MARMAIFAKLYERIANLSAAVLTAINEEFEMAGIMTYRVPSEEMR
ncbi:hypothetical protein ACO2RV_00095 [Ancylobacter sp. VNQ12]